ncbi:MAG: TraR/DksA C4-type zinc finger protein [Labilithrix sp.]|nr:TraR/DksA C4-type zinc finger protein [Labilithrix sp.]MCW5817437.1 TraR/DksA C4-type zinc finger protein [Labilithrix sp.]
MMARARSAKENEKRDLSAHDKKHLKQRLEEERRSVVGRLRAHLGEATEDTHPLADEMDLATRHQDQAYLLRLAEKERKLLIEINHALAKFDGDSYGACEGTGEPIGLRRLEARPWTRFSIAYKEQLERERAAKRER